MAVGYAAFFIQRGAENISEKSYFTSLTLQLKYLYYFHNSDLLKAIT